MQAQGESGRLVSLDAMRGVAALGVVWFHMTNGYHWDLVRWSGYEGRLGVACFFVISGFAVPYSMQAAGYRAGSMWRFLARRLVRLEPAYLASIAIAALVAWCCRGSSVSGYSGAEIAAHIFYLIPLTRFQWINPVYWTLAYEFAFYTSAAVLFPLLWRRNVAWTLALGALASIAIPADHEFHGLVMCFVVGVAACRHWTAVDSAAAFLAALAGSVALMIFEGGIAVAITSTATVAIVLRARLPNMRLVSALAAISYSLYLVHAPAAVLEAWAFGPGRTGLAAEFAHSGAALATSVLMASMLYWTIERPALRLSRAIGLGTIGRPSRPEARRMTAIQPATHEPV